MAIELNKILFILAILTGATAMAVGLFIVFARFFSSYRWLAFFLVNIGLTAGFDAFVFFLGLSLASINSYLLFLKAFLPAFLYSFVWALRGDFSLAHGKFARPLAWLLYSLGITFGIVGLLGLPYESNWEGFRELFFYRLTPWGVAYHLFLLFSLTFGIMQVEQVLGCLQDPIRYRFKWILLGTAALAGGELLQSAHTLLLGRLTGNVVVLTSLGTFFALLLLAGGLLRTRLRVITGQVYVSPEALHGSVTLLLVGAYLALVGLAAEWARTAGGVYGPGLAYAAVFAGIVCLAIVSLSRSVRISLKTLVARHFYSSRHDYRAKWREITEAFQLTSSVEAILSKLVEVLGQTFQAGRISVWIAYDADGSFHQVQSMNTVGEASPIPADHQLIDKVRRATGPLDIMISDAMSDPVWDEFLQTTQAALLVPLKAGDQLLGFAALSQLPDGATYTTDDKDLLHGIAYHVAVLLSHAALSEEQAAAVELNALHQFSAFCLHDIKNLAARLSLVVENAKVYGDDHAFQQSAMQAVDRTVIKMHQLIAKLAASHSTGQGGSLLDVKTCIEDGLGSLAGVHHDMQVEVMAEDGLIVQADRDQLQQVFLNLILNARQASGSFKGICITARRDGGMVYVEVRDHGSGMDTAQLRTLFHPFKSTKAEGLGVGLYQCRQIIERLGGRFLVRSRLGQGTIASIQLPAAPSAADLTVNITTDGKHGSS